MSGPDGPVRPSLAGHVDQVCDRFEAAWRSGGRPRIEDFVGAATGPERSALLRELIVTELELRRDGGERPAGSEYAARFPGDATIVGPLFEEWAAGQASTLETRGPDDGANQARRILAPRAAKAKPAVPGYEIQGELGRGGMGVVYLARQVRLNRPCALKMILAGSHAGAEASARFRAEAEAIARVQHPNVVQVYAIGDADDLPYFELEYVPGGGLDQRIDGTPWPARAAAQLVESLARAAHEAHRLGIVHRDLKPANILLAADGTPKIADFGLAKALDSDGGLTRTEAILGTPSYMAPEQAEGQARRVGPLADVHALGAILYELLTGRPPFKAATQPETLALVRSAEPVPPTRLRPDLSIDLETICLKCLRKEPARRYDSAAALADDLRRYLDGRPILARPVGPAERLWRWMRREPTLALLAASVAALLGATAGGAGLVAWQARRSELRERELADAAEQNLAQARQVVEEMYTQVADSLDDRAGMDDYQRELLRKALRFYEGFALARSRGRAVRYEAGRAGGRVGDIERRLGRMAPAEAAYRRA